MLKSLYQGVIYFFILVCLNIGVKAQNYVSSSNALNRQIQSLRDDPEMKNASWGLWIKEVNTEQPLASVNENLSVVPASTQKIIPTATALLMFGKDFKYQTFLEYSGEVDRKGVLRGNLYIKGSGDPTFGSAAMSDSLALPKVLAFFTDALKEMGIKSISGHIIADETVFDYEMVPRKWLWEDIGNYFGAGSSGLTLNENEYTVFFEAGPSEGSPAKVMRTEPVVPQMRFVNQVTTGPRSSGDQVYIFGAPFQDERILTGTVPLGSRDFPVRGSLPDPPLFFAHALKDHLAGNRIEVKGKPFSMRTAKISNIATSNDRKLIAVWNSPPLSEIVERTNMISVNTYAENLVKTIGYQINGEGTLEAGLEAVKEFWEEKGLEWNGIKLHDGSGLSPSNRLTVKHLGQILAFVAESSEFEPLHKSLPKAGYSGSIARQFRGTPSEGVLRAKSGFLSNVRAYAGYTSLANGNTAVFAFIINDYHGSPASMRNKMVLLMDAITRHPGTANQ